MTYRDSVNISGFCSITLIAFVWFYSYLHHTITIRQCMFDMKIGAEGSVLQELCHFVILTIRCLYYDWYYILCEINSSESFHWIFSILCRYVKDILKMCMKKFDAEKIFFNIYRAFNLSYFPTTAPSKLWLIVHTLWKRYLNLFSILQICYRHIEDVHEEDWCWKNIFWQTYRVFLLSHFSMTAPSNWWLIVYTLWNQLLLELSLHLFNALKICCIHTEDVHEEVWCRKNIFWQT